MIKKCSCCGEEKQLNNFSKHSGNKDKLQTICKICISLYNKEYRNNNKEKIKRQKSQDYKKNKDKYKMQQKNRRLENPEKAKEQDRKKYLRNREKYLIKAKLPENKQNKKIYNKEYHATPKGRFHSIKRNATNRNLSFELDLKNFTENFYKKPCFYCEEESTGIDRVNNNVGYIIGNMVPSCQRCNHLKRHWTLKELKQLDNIISKVKSFLNE